jgi:chromosome segregation ATPase
MPRETKAQLEARIVSVEFKMTKRGARILELEREVSLVGGALELEVKRADELAELSTKRGVTILGNSRERSDMKSELNETQKALDGVTKAYEDALEHINQLKEKEREMDGREYVARQLLTKIMEGGAGGFDKDADLWHGIAKHFVSI